MVRVVCATDWMTAEPFCTSSSSSFSTLSTYFLPSFTSLSLLLLLLLSLSASSSSVNGGDSPGWRITAQLDKSRWTTRLVTTHFFLSLLSSSSGTRCKRGRLILNLLPFNKVRVRFDPFSWGQRDLQIVREIRNELDVFSLFPFYYNNNYHYSFN